VEHTFTDQNFDEEVLKSPAPVFVDFWAPWCGPCQMMGPIIASIAKEMESKNIKIGKLNVDENQEKASEYNVMSIPTFLIFKNGKVVDQVVGGVQKEKLEEVIKKHL
jgi:thioredoxin 1